MRCRSFLGFSWILCVALLATGAAADTPTAKEIGRLIGQLGSNSFTERESAMKELDAVGAPALPGLKQAAKSLDAETRRRAEELIAKIEKRQDSARLLAPTKVSLQLKEVLLAEAIPLLAKQSGQAIVLGGDLSKVASRKVTLELNEVPFWEALDRFCRAAALTEAATVEAPLRVNPPPGKVRPRLRQPVLAPGQAANQIVLVDGKPLEQPTHFAGAARLRALPPSTHVLDVPRNPGEIVLALGLGLEVKLPLQRVLNVQIEKAIDDRDQKLEALPIPPAAQDPNGPVFIGNVLGKPQAMVSTAGQQQAPIRFKAGEQPSRTLKELTGAVRVEVLTPPEPLITVEDVLKSAGKTVNGSNGGALTVQEVKREEDGQVKVQVELVQPADMNGGNPLGGNIQIQGAWQIRVGIVQIGGNVIAGNPGADLGLSLLDVKGQLFQLVSNPIRQWKINNNQVSHELTLHFKPQPGQAEPAKLIHSGVRLAVVEIPFSLKDVPLPATR
jgi:hypothetical protein